MTDPSHEPQSPMDVSGYGRVGGIDDPAPRAGYGDDPVMVREHAEAATRDDCDDGDDESNATLYYLPLGADRTRDLRERIRQESAVSTLAEFAACYEHVGKDHANSLHDLWKQWNRGSGAESKAFIDAACRSLAVGDNVLFDGYPSTSVRRVCSGLSNSVNPSKRTSDEQRPVGPHNVRRRDAQGARAFGNEICGNIVPQNGRMCGDCLDTVRAANREQQEEV